MSIAEYRPANKKIHAVIHMDGKIVCVFKIPPTDEQGHAMAAAISTTTMKKERHSPRSMDLASRLLNR